MAPPPPRLLVATLATFGAPCAVHAYQGRSPLALRARGAARALPPRLLDGPLPDESFSDDDDDREKVNDFRAQLLRQFGSGGGDAPNGEAAAVEQLMSAAVEQQQAGLTISETLAAGQVLVAHPQRFCSGNPFARPVKDMGRFGLQGPVSDPGLAPDVKAQMLPVLLLIEHGSRGSTALLMERRTGALMGDISMEDYGCVAIAPLWLGGTAKQNSLYVVHNVDDVERSTPVRDGLWLGGWADARPRVADSTLAEGRFKFFLGATEWGPGQLEQELQSGAWLALDCSPELVIKDRVLGWQPGKPKPVWTELLALLGEEGKKLVNFIYPADDDD